MPFEFPLFFIVCFEKIVNSRITAASKFCFVRRCVFGSLFGATVPLLLAKSSFCVCTFFAKPMLPVVYSIKITVMR